MNIREFINNYNNHPVLFIGTGFSLRYLDNSYTWDGLLKHIAYELTNNNEFFLDLKSKSQKEDGVYSYEKIATNLETLFNEKLEKERDGKFKEINDIFYENMEKGINISRFKIYISQLMGQINLNDTKEAEIIALKKVRKNIGSIITTNYDKLIETIFEFNPLIGNNILLSNPYGSVYKIHGCVSQPDMIIISEKDYEIFEQKYELIRAQLLSLFIHNPIIFIGYSVNDENIRNLLKTIFTYIPPNSEIADKIKSNFLLIEYEPDSSNLEVHDHDIVLEGLTTLRVNKLKTDNFLDVYNLLSSLQLPVSAMDIRKVQTIVKEIYEGGNIQVSIVDDIDNLKNSEKVLAIGNTSRIKYDFQSTSEIMSNYFKIIEEDNSQLLQLIDKQKIQSQQFFPIFAFSKINSTILNIDKLKQQQMEKLRKINYPMNCKTDNMCIEDILANNTIAPSGKATAITYGILYNNLPLDNVRDYLISIDDKKSTEYRKILCAYDFMKYKSNESL